MQRVDGAGPAALTTTDDAVTTLPGSFTRDQVELIKRTVADGTSDDELALFLEVCKSTGLNPFQRQIYAIMRQESYKAPSGRWEKRPKMTIQTGIDGYRLIAARTGLHAGTSDATYGPPDADGYPEWASVVVRKLMPATAGGGGGTVAEFVGTARWSEYVQTKDEYQGGQKTGKSAPSGQWPKMPFLMLGKCAEALALRRAFPAELSGVYTNEEMAQADGHTSARPATIEDADVVESRPVQTRIERPTRPADPRERVRQTDFPGKALVEGLPPKPATSSEFDRAAMLRELTAALGESHSRRASGDDEGFSEPLDLLLGPGGPGASWPEAARVFARVALVEVGHGATVREALSAAADAARRDAQAA